MKQLFISLILVLLSASLFSQSTDTTFIIKSEPFGKERKVYVHLPERYLENPKDSFGVIYFLDGQGTEYWNNGKSIVDYLVWSYQIMPVICVGIHSDDRGSEFVPLDENLDAGHEDNFGRAHLLQKHINEEIFPLIERHFRTTAFRALIGHSRGGAFVAETLFSDKKDMFNAYIGISPGMHYINRQILNRAEKMIQGGDRFHKFYFCTHGTVGALEKYFKPQVDFLDSLFSAHPNPTIEWSKKEISATSHWGCVAPSLTLGLLKMNRAYQADQYLIDLWAEKKDVNLKQSLENYSANQFRKLNYYLPVDGPNLRYYAEQQAEYDNHGIAIQLHSLALAKGLKDYRSFTNLAWSYRSLKQNEKALEYYKKALEYLETNKAEMSPERHESRVKHVKKKIRELEN